MFSLQPGTRLLHKRYGPAEVMKIIPDMGVVIQPATDAGKRLLCADSGAEYGTPLLEHSARTINPINSESVKAFDPK